MQIDITSLPQLTAPKGSAGQFTFELIGRPGASYEIQSAPDLSAWSPWLTTNVTGLSLQLLDSAAAAVGRRFYRAVSR